MLYCPLNSIDHLLKKIHEFRFDGSIPEEALFRFICIRELVLTTTTAAPAPAAAPAATTTTIATTTTAAKTTRAPTPLDNSFSPTHYVITRSRVLGDFGLNFDRKLSCKPGAFRNPPSGGKRGSGNLHDVQVGGHVFAVFKDFSIYTILDIATRKWTIPKAFSSHTNYIGDVAIKFIGYYF